MNVPSKFYSARKIWLELEILPKPQTCKYTFTDARRSIFSGGSVLKCAHCSQALLLIYQCFFSHRYKRRARVLVKTMIPPILLGKNFVRFLSDG